MLEIFNLPTLLRLFLFASMTLILLILTILIICRFLAKNKNVSLILYLSGLFISLLMMIISRTPLYDGIKETTFYILNCAFLFPIAISIILFCNSKKITYIIDFIFLTLNLPFFAFLSIWKYIYITSIYYYLMRILVECFKFYHEFRGQPGIYMIKEALDTLKRGIIFANDNGQINFINKSMDNYLKMLNVDQHNRVNKIIEILSNHQNVKRVLNNNSIIIEIDDISLNFQFVKNSLNNRYSQIICTDVTEKERVSIQLENTKNELMSIQNDLNQTLSQIDEIEKNKEILRIKGNLHDIMSQRLSILHCYIIENKYDDIKQIKQLISSMLTEMYNNDENNDKEKRLIDLVKSYNLVNVKLKIDGELPQDVLKSDFILKAIRECTTNAIKHGNATLVNVSIKNFKNGSIRVAITNNGVTTKKIVANTGLSNIEYQLKQLNGKMTIATKPGFKISFKL